MLFNSLDFVIFFVIVLTSVAIIKNRKFKHLFLLYSSYFFFYYTSNYLIVLLIASTLLDFYIAKFIWKTPSIIRKKILLCTSLSGNLGLLGFFKYSDFAILQFNIIGTQFNGSTEIPFLNLALPIGISFYTFQTISYTVDVYRGKLEPSKSLKEFALFVSFFPQLVAGPIVRAKDFLPQLREKIENNHVTSKLRLIRIEEKNLKIGITVMIIGFLKKMFFADNIAPFVNEVFGNPVGHESFTIILATIGFAIQIYGDFSGYSDIAIGAALILGFKLPINFNKPYFATSPSDFWKRWHISLSSWLRDYLYIPLGGSKKSNIRTYVNLTIVMFLGGLWHGASWNFVVWGLLHGGYLAIHRLIINKFPIVNESKFFKTRIGKIVSILVMQYFVFLAWIPFRIEDTDHMIYAITKYLYLDFNFEQTLEIIQRFEIPVFLMLLFVILHFISYKYQNLIDKIANYNMKKWFLFSTICIALIVFFYGGTAEEFIYFKF